jgi:hypothetical protein
MRLITQILSIFLFTCTNCFDQDSIVAEHYKTSEFDCAIFPANSFAFVPGAKRFTPTHQDIDKAEHALNTQLKALDSIGYNSPRIYKHLQKYGRQYFGYIDSLGHRMLLINCIWKDKDFDDMFDRDFLRQIIMVDDGGDNFWNVKCNIDTDKLFELEVNGQG